MMKLQLLSGLGLPVSICSFICVLSRKICYSFGSNKKKLITFLEVLISFDLKNILASFKLKEILKEKKNELSPHSKNSSFFPLKFLQSKRALRITGAESDYLVVSIHHVRILRKSWKVNVILQGPSWWVSCLFHMLHYIYTWCLLIILTLINYFLCILIIVVVDILDMFDHSSYSKYIF
jgi:hypothetical protein